MIKKFNFILISSLFYFFLFGQSEANFQEKLINKYNSINTISFDFTQKIGDKIESGNCYIKYPLLMKCEYPKKKKVIISNGKRIAIIKKRYKKIYYYPLKKTFFSLVLKKENILNLVKNHKPSSVNSYTIEYELSDDNSNKLDIFFDRNSFLLSRWKTTDAYSNEVDFLIENIETNIPMEDKTFRIPREEDL